ncbi:MAG: UDP-N-acetylmuramate--L-alanine ligase [Bdellovibrionaceae bacterium]|nr:UDP-N-acetylmuramate--L-alanine ligase [Pseudobdellovibrionaceae bacterium]MDW8189622.1 UDP-N-acetylmuramate--L-alanine ligase [Pseudobdellovibrionaceae bacterium]
MSFISNRQSIAQVPKGAKIYLMGICGTAMASFAGILKDMGYRVTGSDQGVYPPMSEQLERLQIAYYKTYSYENLVRESPDFVVVGNVISASNPEVKALQDLKLPFTSFPQALGELILCRKETLVVAGTHGKTTTTSCLSWVLECAGWQPSFLIGGIPKNFGQSFRYHQGSRNFVIEGDEYDTAFFDKVPKFTHYFPHKAILTSVEFDHADIYRNLGEVEAAFQKLVDLIPSEGEGLLVACGDDKNVLDLTRLRRSNAYSSSRSNYPIIYYGWGEHNQVRCVGYHREGENLVFEVTGLQNCERVSFSTTLVGKHNISNLMGVIALCHYGLNIPIERIIDGIRTFEGVRRRCDVLGTFDGVTVIEDFAHHPTAVKETLGAIREKYGTRKIWAVFEPRSATSRRRVFQSDYVSAFSHADIVLIKEAFDQSKIPQEERFSSQELVDDLKKSNQEAYYFAVTEHIVDFITQRAQKGDIIVIMSNGGFDNIYGKLMSSLRQRALVQAPHSY